MTRPVPSCVLHVPHASVVVPADVRAEFLLDADGLEAELELMTDHLTDELFAPPGPEFVQVRFPVSRLALDPERFIDDEAEPMAGRGMGVIYERTADGRELRPRPSAQRREDLLDRHYRPHHAQLTACVSEALEAHGRALIVDGHSFPDGPLPCDLDPMEERPDVCLGTDPFHTPAPLVDALAETCRALCWSVGVNRPYAGTIVPTAFFGKEPRVSSVMIEINRRLYLEGGSPRPNDRFQETRAGVQRLLEAAVEAVEPNTEESRC